MTLLIVDVFAVAAFAISAWFTHLFCNLASAVYVLDHPNERSLHDRAVPRGGGLAILLAILAGGLGATWLHSAAGLAVLAFGVVLVGSVSFLDDRYSIPPLHRLLAHVIAVAVFLYQGYVLEILVIPGASLDWSHGVAVAFSLLFCVWLINLYNFMDGMDGFAGGMAVSGFGRFAVMGWLAGHELFFIVSLIIASASAGFLVFNFPPARIFMGDVGSSTLGFLAAAFCAGYRCIGQTDRFSAVQQSENRAGAGVSPHPDAGGGAARDGDGIQAGYSVVTFLRVVVVFQARV